MPLYFVVTLYNQSKFTEFFFLLQDMTQFMSCRLGTSTICLLLLISSYCVQTAHANDEDLNNDVISEMQPTCPEARSSMCNACKSTYGVATSRCCSDDVIFTLCDICTASPEKCEGVEDDNDVDKRARHFLGKRGGGRSSYFLGKRPRNNFLGKRSDEVTMDDEMWGVDPDVLSGDSDKRRWRPFLGKRPQPFLGKRAKYFLGKRDDENEFSLDEDKRAKYFLGKRADDSEFDFDEEKRAKYFLGKRDDESDSDFEAEKRAKYFLGKRAKYFLGKRARYFLGKRSDVTDNLDDMDDMKRAKYFLGKRRQHFLGKRSSETELSKDVE